jgi:uncharacterized membrane protein
MIDDLLFALTLGAALGSGVIAGVFFAFSSFVMKALAHLPAPQGIAAMQSINVTVLNPWFLSTFGGTALASILLIASSVMQWGESDATIRLIGAGLYIAGAFVVTVAFNVPRNESLAKINAESDDGAASWAEYVPAWTAWNTVRTAASAAASASLIIALVMG